MDFYGFYTGKIFDAYEFLGAHPDKDGTTFRTFASAFNKIVPWMQQQITSPAPTVSI